MTSPLDTLVRDLRDAVRDDAGRRQVVELLSTYADAHDDWRPWALKDETCYTRNLVERNEDYELLLLYWPAGQASPIHNHEGQHCWMAVLEGQVQEASFGFPTGEGPLPTGPVNTFDPGGVAYIVDEVGLHEVRAASPDADAVSLHLYSKPYDACNCYCPATGKITRSPLSYYSIRGVRTPDAVADDAATG